MGFVEYCVANYKLDIDLYGGNKLVAGGADAFLSWLDGIGCASYDAMRKYGFYAPGSFQRADEKARGHHLLWRAKMGEGWLLTAEMIELIEGGYGNIVCAQPFGCLPNHIVGKGMIRKITRPAPGREHRRRGLRPQRDPRQPGKPHQADAGRSPREAGPARRGTACHRGTAGRRRTAGGDGGTINV